METIRQVIAYKRYFLDFYEDQTDEVQRKIEWTLNLLRTIDRVPKKYFDHMTGTDGLFEVRGLKLQLCPSCRSYPKMQKVGSRSC